MPTTGYRVSTRRLPELLSECHEMHQRNVWSGVMTDGRRLQNGSRPIVAHRT